MCVETPSGRTLIKFGTFGDLTDVINRLKFHDFMTIGEVV
jgi:hypothetical protein